MNISVWLPQGELSILTTGYVTSFNSASIKLECNDEASNVDLYIHLVRSLVDRFSKRNCTVSQFKNESTVHYFLK